MPRVVVAHDYLTQRGGAERVALAMLEAFPGARMLTTVYAPESTFPEFRAHEVETGWLNRLSVVRRDPRLGLPLLGPAVWTKAIPEADVLVASSSGWAHGFGYARKIPKVIYCHNPARWLYQPLDYMQGLAVHGKLALKTLAPVLRRWDHASAHTATVYLANSTVVQKRIKDTYGIDAELLFPPVAVDPDGEQTPLTGIEPGYLLTVSRKRGYKNTLAVCEAAEQLPGVRLVVVGGLPERRTPWPDRIVGVSGISDAELRWLYAHARGLVAVSREDFGLTPVESYAFGAPSVLWRSGGYLDSSVEGLTTVFVGEPGHEPSTTEIVEGMRTLLDRQWDHAAIRKHAAQFSLPNFQRRLREVVDRVLTDAAAERARG